MARLLYVVHRYAPFPGGSEYYVQNMAEESDRRGHDVTVLTSNDPTTLNGIKVVNDFNVLYKKFDLIIVHGCDVLQQNAVLSNSGLIKSPILYMIIKPSDSMIAQIGMKNARFLGYSTTADIEHIRKYGYMNKARRVVHGINPSCIVSNKEIVTQDYRKKRFVNSDEILLVSAGGFAHNKGMKELIEVFTKSSIANKAKLHLYGYYQEHLVDNLPIHENVSVFTNASYEQVQDAIASADLYVLNSFEEGYGLVLLEAMANRTQWIGRDIAGAHDLAQLGLGTVYTTNEELYFLFEEFVKYIDYYRTNEPSLELGVEEQNYVLANHTIRQTVNDIEDILRELV